MAGTKQVYLNGKISWFHYKALNKYGKYSCRIHPTEESLKVIRELRANGLKNVEGKDEDGYHYNFHCEPQKLMLGKMVLFTVTALDGKKPITMPDGTKGYEPITENIGNGSDGVMKLDVFYYKGPPKGCGARLRSVRIDNLVPYEPNRDLTPEDKDAGQGLGEQPEQLF